MNIFASDEDPAVSARNLDLKRVIKMILESCQLMSNAMWAHQGYGFYRQSYFNHPCSIWVRASKQNFTWLLNHTKELMKVYSEHYGKVHRCEAFIPECEQFVQWVAMPSHALTPFANCTDYKNLETHKAYRFQLLKKWEGDKQPPRWPANVDQVALVNDWRRELATSSF